MNKIRILLCGMGGYGEKYLREILTKDIPDAELVAIADPFAEKSALYEEARKKQYPLYSSPEEFFRDNEADLTIVSSPIHTHYPYIMLALEHGSNVLTEKPVCFNEEQIDEMMRRAEEVGRFVEVGYQLCFASQVLALKKDVLAGRYGKCLRARTIRMMKRNDIYYSRNNWAAALYCHGEKVLDSPFSNACAHQLQNLVFVLGSEMDTTADVVKAEGKLIRVRPGIENYDTAALRFMTDGGTELYYYVTHAVDENHYGPYSEYEFENGIVIETSNDFVGKLYDGSVIDYTGYGKTSDLEKLHAAIRAIKEKTSPICTLKTSRTHTKAVLLAQELGVEDHTADAIRKIDEKNSTYYTLDGLKENLRRAYDEWRLL